MRPVLALVVLVAVLLSAAAQAAERMVASGELQSALAAAAPGDVLVLQPGVHAGPIVVAKPLTLAGTAGSSIDAGGTGRVITVDAPDVVLRELTVRGSGNRLDREDSAIFVTDAGDRALITGCLLESNLIGINLKGPDDAVVRDNVIYGSRDPRMNDRGNGIHLWNTPGTVVAGNTVHYGRDGIFVMASNRNTFSANRLSDMRYAIHYMYTHDSEVSSNFSERNNSAFVLMYSERLLTRNNVSAGDRERGLFLHAANNSAVSDNAVFGGAEKCVFIYNSNVNVLTDNYFEGCDIGIHFAGSEDNAFSGNAFIANRTQVKYVGARHVEWSVAGRGNYWSDNPTFDLNNDGIADKPFRPNDMVDQLLWKHPLAKLLINTPAMELLRWAQAEFPAVYPGGVVDSAPLMQAPVARPTG